MPRTLLRSLRIYSGSYLFLYVTLHLVNLSLGLISIEAMDAARPYLSGIMGHPMLRPILSTALLVHYVIGLWSVYNRPRITGTAQDMVQALSGLAIIPLMAIHAVGVIMLQDANVVTSYDLMIRIFWISNPVYGLMQVMLLSVAWVHGAAGIFMWLRSMPSMATRLPWIYPLAVAVPVLALLGFTEAGRVILVDGGGPQIMRTFGADPATLGDVPFALIIKVQYAVLWLSIAISLGVLLARGIRAWVNTPETVHINNKDVGAFKAQTGQFLLDAFRTEGQAHASLCSGRGRCGTCAVRVLAGASDLSPPTPLEQATLDRIHQGGLNKDIRLACQLPLEHGGELTVERVYPPDFSFAARHEDDEKTASQEVSA
jgi:adenylate cyclase